MDDHEPAASDPVVSIIAPVYNEEAGVEELVTRIADAAGRTGEPFEIVIVDDGSSDGTLANLIALSRRVPELRAVSLTRNFGVMSAISAGLAAARGEAMITIDGDLQDPPELIPEFVAEWRDGADVVYGLRTERKDGPVLRALIAVFYWLMGRLSDISIPGQVGNCGLMNRRTADIFNALPERQRFFAGLRSWIGGKQAHVTYRRETRRFGDTRQGLSGLFGHARMGLLGFSKAPLRLASLLSLLTSLVLLVISAVAVGVRIGTDLAIPGWATYTALIGGMGFVQSLVLAIMAEYLGAVFDEVKARPVYLVDAEFAQGAAVAPASSRSGGERPANGPGSPQVRDVAAR